MCLIFTGSVQAQADSPAADDTGDAAQAFFQKSLAAMKTRQSVQAKLVELVHINDQPLRMTGQYQEQGRKTRLELQVRLSADSQGSLLEVSDGELLWSQTKFSDVKQVTLRNLKLIAAALAEQPELTPPGGGPPDLGLGGLSGLMTSLDRTMEFDQLREETEGDSKLVVIQGSWKADYEAQWKQKPEDDLPPYLPDALRIAFDAETLFPRRLLYLKRNPEKKTSRALVRLELTEVKLDQAVDPSAFEYTPPEDLVPDDITQQYIEQMKPRAPSAGPAQK